MLAKTCALALAVCSSALAQTPPCESRNDSNTNISGALTASPFVGLNPSRYAYQFAASATNVVEAAAIFTDALAAGGNRYMRIEIWDSDDPNQLPNNILARGSCKLGVDRKWYGVNLDTPVILNAGTNYWFVVNQPGFIQLFEEPGGTVLPRRIATGSTPNWGSVGSGSPKMRLFCGRIDSADSVPTGDACPNSLGQLGTIFTNDVPNVGNSDFLVEGTNLPGGASATLLIGFDLGFPSIDLGFIGLPNGCFLHTDGIISTTGTVGVGEVGDSGHPNPIGHVEFNLPISPNAAVGLTFEAQIFATDAGQVAPIPLIATNSIQVTIAP